MTNAGACAQNYMQNNIKHFVLCGVAVFFLSGCRSIPQPGDIGVFSAVLREIVAESRWQERDTSMYIVVSPESAFKEFVYDLRSAPPIPLARRSSVPKKLGKAVAIEFGPCQIWRDEAEAAISLYYGGSFENLQFSLSRLRTGIWKVVKRRVTVVS